MKSAGKAMECYRPTQDIEEVEEVNADRKMPMLSSLEQNILGCLCQLYRLGVRGPANLLYVAQACGYKNIETRSFRAARIRLRTLGLLKFTGGTVQLTPAGVASLPKDSGPRFESNWEFHDYIKRHFDNNLNIARIIDVLADGGSRSSRTIAKLLGYKHPESRGFRLAKNALKELYFLEGTSVLKLTDHMFPFGRPVVMIV